MLKVKNKFWEKITNIKNYLRLKSIERKKLEGILYNNINYIQNGKYYISGYGKRIIYKTNKDNENFVNNITKNIVRENKNLKCQFKQQLKLKILKRLFRITIKSEESKENKLNGSIIIITRNGEVKIVDLQQNIMITIFKEKNEYDKRKQIYQYFINYFNTPIIMFDDLNYVIKEKVINFLPGTRWPNEKKHNITKIIIENYISYVSNLDKYNCNQICIRTLLYELAQIDTCRSGINEDVKSIIPQKYWDETFILIPTHGDFSFLNILLENSSKDRCYYIDWEDSKNSIFFSDIINLFCTDARNNDYSLLKNFLDGEYDSYFSKLFLLAGNVFLPEKRLFYLGVYIADRVVSFDKNNDYLRRIQKHQEIIKWVKTNYL